MRFCFLTIIFSITLLLSSYAQSTKIHIDISNHEDSALILGYYFNKQMFVEDTIPRSTNGSYIISSEEPLKQGIYIIYLNTESFFDILIGGDQEFSIQSSADNLFEELSIKGSNESEAFLNYQKVLRSKQKEAQSIQERYKASTDEKKKLGEQLSQMGLDVKAAGTTTIENNPNTFLAVFLKGLQEIEVPEMKDDSNKALSDQEIQQKRFNYYKAHYFDNIDFQDERLLRTPYFTDKIERYLTQTLVIPDSIIIGCHKMIAMASGNEEMEKYLIQYLFNWANESKTMGMDAVMVDLGEAYYLSGKADWVDDEFLAKLRERVDKIKPNLLNKVAADFKMESYTGEYYKLSEIVAPFTILVFWEPECGHCEKEVPKLNEEVWKSYADRGVKIVAVFTQHEKESWEEFISNHQLEEWIHLYDPYNRSGYRNNYDIYSTPVIYILDKDKKILAKRLGVDQIPGFLDHHFKNM